MNMDLIILFWSVLVHVFYNNNNKLWRVLLFLGDVFSFVCVPF